MMLSFCRLLLLTSLASVSSAAVAADDAKEKLKSAEGLVRSGSLDEAEKVLLGIEKPPARALQLLGQVQVRLKKYEDAIKTYEKYVSVETIPSKKSAGAETLQELRTLAKTRFKILTTPPGATVYIDSKVEGPKGKTPLSQLVTPGKHKVILELEGFETINVSVSAVDQQELELPFVMLPVGCELTVTSDPPGAKVFIDGKSAGATPIGRRLRGGSYRVEAILQPGDPPVVRQVACDERDQKPLQVHLGPEKSDQPAPAPSPIKDSSGKDASGSLPAPPPKAP